LRDGRCGYRGCGKTDAANLQKITTLHILLPLCFLPDQRMTVLCRLADFFRWPVLVW
jgi:hypothetical protein